MSSPRTRRKYLAHSQSRHPLYARWLSMIYRCHDSKSADYPLYGARGVTVCMRWRNSFASYAADVGNPPFKGAHLSRIDPRGDYQPGNVEWVSNERNLKNSSSTRHVTTHDGVKTLADASRDVGKEPSNVYSRVRKGMAPSQALIMDKRVQKQIVLKYPQARELALRTISTIALEANVAPWLLRARLKSGMTVSDAIHDIRYGRADTLSTRARANGIDYHTAYGRVKAGWSVADAVSIPSRRKS